MVLYYILLGVENAAYFKVLKTSLMTTTENSNRQEVQLIMFIVGNKRGDDVFIITATFTTDVTQLVPRTFKGCKYI